VKAKIAAFGEKDIMLIFKAVGIDVMPADKNLGFEKQFEELIKENYAVIFITETIAVQIKPLIEKYMTKTLPSIVIIPGLGEKQNYSIELLRKGIIKAIGVDLFTQN
jgi:V/A-type H+-transporting ATPase subunit F